MENSTELQLKAALEPITRTMDDLRRDLSQKMDEQNKRIAEVEKKAEANYKFNFGNGEAGADEKLRNINAWIEEQKKEKERRREWWNKLQWVIIPLLITGVFAFIGQALYFYFTLVPKIQALP